MWPSPIYAASKHGIVGFVRAIGRTMARDGIAINAIAPNYIRMISSPHGFSSQTNDIKILTKHQPQTSPMV
jgi:NAD(P)-dependent dehydrogenase (short-subunit alcohol dehydrogenase family)